MAHAPRAARILARLEQLPSARVVSLDVFDTMLIRLVPPSHALLATAEQLAQALANAHIGATPDAASIAAHRQAFARSANGRPGAGGEYTVRQWLAALAADHALPLPSVLALGTHAELETERRLTCADPDAIELLEALRARRIAVVATSDTWLDHDLLGALLEYHGFALDHVFASGSLAASKRRGTLFGVVAHTLGVPAEAILHVGDNYKADLVRPLQAGFLVASWPRRADDAPRLLVVRVPELAAALAVAPTEPDGTNALYEAGRSLLAPMLVAVTIANHAALLAANVQHVAYIARDAWPLFGVAERLAGQLAANFERSYIRLSRRALSLAHPGDLLSRSVGLAGRFGKANAGELLAGFDLSAELHYDLLAAAGLSDDSPLRPGASAALRRACEQLAPRIAVAQREQRQLLRDYLEGHGIGAHNSLAIVDTGWAGTTQDAVAAVLPEAQQVVGLYLGVSRGGLPDDHRSKKFGILWDDPRGQPPLNPLERSAGVIRVWDLLMREPAPTVRCLRRAPNGAVVARMYESRAGFDVAAASELSAGISAGVAAIEPRIPAIQQVFAPENPVWREAARALAAELTTRPSRSFAHAISELAIDEGAAQGARTGLGFADLRTGLAWYPGVAAQLGFGGVVRAAATMLRSRG